MVFRLVVHACRPSIPEARLLEGSRDETRPKIRNNGFEHLCAPPPQLPSPLLLSFFFFFFWFFFFFFFSELGTEPRALRFLGKHSTTELNPQPPIQSFLGSSSYT